jgi:hypothetical protein
MEAALFSHPAFKEVTERSITLGDAVLESEYRVVPEKLGRNFSNFFFWESFGSRFACCEGNNFWIRSKFEYFTDSGSVELAYFIRKFIFHV